MTQIKIPHWWETNWRVIFETDVLKDFTTFCFFKIKEYTPHNMVVYRSDTMYGKAKFRVQVTPDAGEGVVVKYTGTFFTPLSFRVRFQQQGDRIIVTPLKLQGLAKVISPLCKKAAKVFVAEGAEALQDYMFKKRINADASSSAAGKPLRVVRRTPLTGVYSATGGAERGCVFSTCRTTH